MMKQKDIFTIIAVGIFASVFSLIVAKVLFHPGKHDATVPEVAAIDTNFPKVQGDPNYVFFDPVISDPIDPTQLIKIGKNENPAPFQTQ